MSALRFLLPASAALLASACASGDRFEVTASTARLNLWRAIVSSVRVLRNYDHDGTAPPEIAAAPCVSERSAEWRRSRLDGAARILFVGRGAQWNSRGVKRRRGAFFNI